MAVDLWLLAFGSWLLALGYWLLALGSLLLVLGSWLLALGSWLLALGSWLMALGSRTFGNESQRTCKGQAIHNTQKHAKLTSTIHALAHPPTSKPSRRRSVSFFRYLLVNLGKSGLGSGGEAT